MCRWLAYSGSPIFMDELLLRPEHSLLTQSRHAREATFEVNADGFGIGWYTDRATPGVYHDTRPAWNDWNLASLSAHIRSPLFFGHIRAAVGSEVVRCNCHPFRHGNWLFQHNGAIAGFDLIKHRLDMSIRDDLYAEKIGQTDSETMFLLALSLGLAEDPFGGICRMIEEVEKAREAAGIEESFHMTVAAADGETIYAARYASHGPQPSLYHSTPGVELKTADGDRITLADRAFLVLSEPLDTLAENWEEVPETSRLLIRAGEAVIGPLFPE
ncbi:MAG: class II glutamine amidotransferase [Phycisphaerales bacterium]|nr:class II glutamine amidotransferase [Phycisphaerales bacterium]